MDIESNFVKNVGKPVVNRADLIIKTISHLHAILYVTMSVSRSFKEPRIAKKAKGDGPKDRRTDQLTLT